MREGGIHGVFQTVAQLVLVQLRQTLERRRGACLAQAVQHARGNAAIGIRQAGVEQAQGGRYIAVVQQSLQTGGQGPALDEFGIEGVGREHRAAAEQFVRLQVVARVSGFRDKAHLSEQV